MAASDGPFGFDLHQEWTIVMIDDQQCGGPRHRKFHSLADFLPPFYLFLLFFLFCGGSVLSSILLLDKDFGWNFLALRALGLGARLEGYGDIWCCLWGFDP